MRDQLLPAPVLGNQFYRRALSWIQAHLPYRARTLTVTLALALSLSLSLSLSLILSRSIAWIQAHLPYWARRGGTDHIFAFPHDEGACQP